MDQRRPDRATWAAVGAVGGGGRGGVRAQDGRQPRVHRWPCRGAGQDHRDPHRTGHEGDQAQEGHAPQERRLRGARHGGRHRDAGGAQAGGPGWVADDGEASYSGRLSATTKPLTDEMRAAVLRLAAVHGARDIRVFGSVARGDAGPDSDLDLLVDFEPGRSLLDQVALAQDLELLLGRQVDVVTEDGLYWLLRRRIVGEARPL